MKQHSPPIIPARTWKTRLIAGNRSAMKSIKKYRLCYFLIPHRNSASAGMAAYPPQTPDLRLSCSGPACRRNPAAGYRQSSGRSGHGFSQKTAAMIGMAYVLHTSRSEDENCLWNLLNDRLDASLVDLHTLFAASIPTWDSLCVLWFIRNIIQITQVISHFINKHSPNFSTCMTNCGSGFALLADADALHQAQSELTHWFQEHRLTAGVGSSGNTLAALRRSYDQARHSLKFAIQAGNYGLAQFSDYQLNYLMSLIPADQAAALLNAGPLSMIETCDQQNGTELLKTVRAYLRCGGT